jgi:hypothetical protein
VSGVRPAVCLDVFQCGEEIVASGGASSDLKGLRFATIREAAWDSVRLRAGIRRVVDLIRAWQAEETMGGRCCAWSGEVLDRLEELVAQPAGLGAVA